MKKDLNNFLTVIFTNVFSLSIGLISGFIIPNLLDLESYAFYKMFMLYISYVGVLHFGLCNGIYMKYGALSYHELPEVKFRTYTSFILFQQLVINLIIIITTVIFIEDFNIKIIICFISGNAFLININTYFSCINQFTKRFVLDSKIQILRNLILIFTIVILLLYDFRNYIFLLIMQTITNFILLCIHMKCNKNIIIGVKNKLFEQYSDLKFLIKNGFLIMFSEFVGIFILGIDSIFINSFFEVKDFAIYSFAVTTISLIFSLINSVSSLIFPYLVRIEKQFFNVIYLKSTIILLVICSIALSSSYIVEVLINIFLPKYIECNVVLGILFPILLFRSQISLIIGNFYKLFQLSKEYAINNIAALSLAIIANIILYLIFKTTEAIAIASVISFFLWYLYSDLYFKRKLQIKTNVLIKKYIYIAFILVVYFISKLFVWYYGFLIYLILVISISFCFYRRDIKGILLYLKNNQALLQR